MPEHSITIESILSSRLTHAGLTGSSKKKVLEQVAKTIAAECDDLEENEIFDNLIARERLGSTGIGQGIAIPHSRTDSCQRVIGCLFTLQEKVEFDAIDNEPVDILFVLLVPKEASSEHLELLSQIAEKFNNADFCRQLRAIDSNQALYDAMVTSR